MQNRWKPPAASTTSILNDGISQVAPCGSSGASFERRKERNSMAWPRAEGKREERRPGNVFLKFKIGINGV